MKCPEVDYEILGHDMQIVEVELDPGETVIAEAGAMNCMEDGITFESRMGDGSQADEGIFGKLMGAGKRAFRTMAEAVDYAGTGLDHLRWSCQTLQVAWNGDFQQIPIRRAWLIAGECGSSFSR